MKIECKIKRAGGTDVDLPPDTIKFRPLDPTRSDSPHVADVTNAQAQSLISADARVYVLIDDAPVAVKFAPPAAVVAPAQSVAEPPAADTAPPKAVEPAAPSAAAAGDTNGDGALSVRELKLAIAGNTLSPERLRELMDQEENSDAPRQSFIAEIVKALK